MSHGSPNRSLSWKQLTQECRLKHLPHRKRTFKTIHMLWFQRVTRALLFQEATSVPLSLLASQAWSLVCSTEGFWGTLSWDEVIQPSDVNECERCFTRAGASSAESYDKLAFKWKEALRLREVVLFSRPSCCSYWRGWHLECDSVRELNLWISFSTKSMMLQQSIYNVMWMIHCIWWTDQLIE